jgi:hypothetical protein
LRCGRPNVRDAVVARVDAALDPTDRFQRLQLPRQRARIDAQTLDEPLLRPLALRIGQGKQDAPAWQRVPDIGLEA